MPRSAEPRARELSLLGLSVALLLLASPLRLLWSRDDTHWLWPFLLWLFVIALGALPNRRRDEP